MLMQHHPDRAVLLRYAPPDHRRKQVLLLLGMVAFIGEVAEKVYHLLNCGPMHALPLIYEAEFACGRFQNHQDDMVFMFQRFCRGHGTLLQSVW